MKLNHLQQERWNAAKKLFKTILDTAEENELIIMYDGKIIDPWNILVGTDSINLIIDDTNYEIFYANPEYDGLDSTIEEFAFDTRARIKLYKEFQY